MISNIITKEFHNINSKLNILWTPAESFYFADFFRSICSCNLIDFDKTYYGINDIGIIICNNRLIYLEKCIELAKFFHCSLLIIDHSVKSNLVNNDFILKTDFEPVYQIATSKEIFFSWNKIHDSIMEYNNNKETIEQWKNLLFQLVKTRFIAKEEKYENKT